MGLLRGTAHAPSAAVVDDAAAAADALPLAKIESSPV